MATGPTKHQEGAAGVGAAREDATEGGGETGHLKEVLFRSNTGGAVSWVIEVGGVGSNGTDARGNSSEAPEKVD